MKTVILAGGFGTRITEESHLKPKPMIEVGDNPILWHIMKIYSSYNFNDFIICGGYKQHVIKEFFANYYINKSDVTFDFSRGAVPIYSSTESEPWRVTVVDTGLQTMTGGRIKRIQKFVGNEPFLLTYGDGVSDIDLNDLIKLHKDTKALLTITAVLPGGRFGALNINQSGNVESFVEKAKTEGGWINGGFMVCEPEVFDYINGDSCVFEKDVIPTLVKEGKVSAYKHTGFWKCMDTLRDKQLLEELWKEGNAPWVRW